MKSLYSSFDRLIKGFYEDSIILARPVYEAFIKAIYIACHPDEPWQTITNQKNSLRKKFNLTNFLKHDLNLKWDDYKFLSTLSHANSYSILNEVVSIEEEGQKDIIALKFRYDKRMFEFGANWIGFLLLVYLKTITYLFIPNDTDNLLIEKGVSQRAKKLVTLKEETFLLHPKQHWPQTIRDLRDILLLMNEVEKGNEWKRSWKEIRSSNNIYL